MNDSHLKANQELWEAWTRLHTENEAERGSFANPEAACVHTAYYWPHSLGETVTSLCAAGLRLQFLHEFPRIIRNCCSYEETETGRYEMRLRPNVVIPHLFSIRATR